MFGTCSRRGEVPPRVRPPHTQLRRWQGAAPALRPSAWSTKAVWVGCLQFRPTQPALRQAATARGSEGKSLTKELVQGPAGAVALAAGTKLRPRSPHTAAAARGAGTRDRSPGGKPLGQASHPACLGPGCTRRPRAKSAAAPWRCRWDPTPHANPPAQDTLRDTWVQPHLYVNRACCSSTQHRERAPRRSHVQLLRFSPRKRPLLRTERPRHDSGRRAGGGGRSKGAGRPMPWLL